MKKVLIHHVLKGKTVVTSILADDREADGILERFARLRANDGAITAPNFAIPARNVELIEVKEP